MLTHFSLFTGIGGIDLAAEWAGFYTVGQCEWADYPTKVLEKHWPDTPRWRDIRDVTAESFRERTELRTVDLISGGFPCQPFSIAGKRGGKKDDRYLWPEMLRVISEIKPTWVLGENVAGIINMALDQVLSDLEGQGYETQAFVIPACGVDAPHKRDRVFIVANTRCTLRQGASIGKADENKTKKRNADMSKRSSSTSSFNVANTYGSRREKFNTSAEPEGKGLCSRSVVEGGGNWAVEPNVGRVANGVPRREDRLKCLGNAVVPQQVYPILQAIADIEGAINN